MASWGPKGPGVGIGAGSNPQQECHAMPTDAQGHQINLSMQNTGHSGLLPPEGHDQVLP